jgi:hypothetical protein
MSEKSAINNLINGNSSEIRRTAAVTLLDEGVFDIETIKALSCALMDNDRGVKDICARAFTKIPDDSKFLAADYIAQYIESENIELRNLAGEILLKLGDSSTQPVLKFIYHPDHYVRQFAVDILANVGNIEISDRLLFLLKDENNNVVSSVIDALGNFKAEKALDTFELLYVENEELRPIIIESVRKIGGTKAEKFLFKKFSEEKDIFLQTECIDALAFVGQDINLCRILLEKLPKTNPEVQGILLKTIYAIAIRSEQIINLPEELRYVARNAVVDSDPDIRAAGLIAMGNVYFEEDVSNLLIEVLNNNPETQQLILHNLLSSSNPDVLEKFLREYSSICNYDQQHTEFFSLLRSVWKKADIINIERLFKILFELIIIEHSGFSVEVIDLLYYVDRARVINWLRKLLLGESFQNKKEIIDIIAKFRFEDMYKDLSILAVQHDELSIYAGTVIKNLKNEDANNEEDNGKEY